MTYFEISHSARECNQFKTSIQMNESLFYHQVIGSEIGGKVESRSLDSLLCATAAAVVVFYCVVHPKCGAAAHRN